MYLYLFLNSCKVQVHEGEDAKEKGNEGKSRGFGFVNFEEHESAVKAIEAFNGTVSSSGVYCVCVLVMLSIVFSAKYRLKILEGIIWCSWPRLSPKRGSAA